MVNPIIKQRVRGRKVTNWPTWKDYSRQGRRGRKRERKDPIRPNPGQRTGIQKIPRTHRSEKEQQDFIEELSLKQIKEELNLDKKKWLEWNHYCWIQNGRPVMGQPKRFSRDGHGHKENLYTHNSKSDRSAFDDLEEEKKKRRIL